MQYNVIRNTLSANPNDLFNTWMPQQNRHHFADNILKCSTWKNVCISIQISLQLVTSAIIGSGNG